MDEIKNKALEKLVKYELETGMTVEELCERLGLQNPDDDAAAVSRESF